MQFQNKERLAFLVSLSMVFSYAEMFLPRFVPFFKLGLANVVVLLSLDLSLHSFLILNCLRLLLNAVLSGILFSPFFLTSFAQGLASSLFMFALYRVIKNRKFLGLYGISVAGAAISNIVQILTSQLYLGKEISNLIGPMLLFAIPSGLFIAFLALHLHIPQTPPELVILRKNESQQISEKSNKNEPVLVGLFILLSIIFVMMTENLFCLACLFVFSLVMQRLCGKRIFILPYLGLWFFILACSLLTPEGRVLFKFIGISLTDRAIILAVQKALKLSIIMSLSQSATTVKISSDSTSLFSKTFLYFAGISSVVKTAEGNLFSKLKAALSSTKVELSLQEKKGISAVKSAVIFAVCLILFIVSSVLF